ncbi:ThuA domain-containing protein [Neorhodopirellula lusitana]|uniref:ThuA domain-containing protein n=1 Tax=Neorhodopirellula lusitana TaxID=445327 RepID=UPI00384FFBAE
MKLNRVGLFFVIVSFSCMFSGMFAEGAEESSQRPVLAMLIGEVEYETSVTLPRFATQALGDDYRVITILEDPEHENHFPGIEQIDQADVLLISTRRKTLPADQLEHVRKFVRKGKPIVGIRTASHAFCLRKKSPPKGLDAWPEFDAEVLGGHYTNHHSRELSSIVRVNPAALNHPILRESFKKPFEQGGSLYKTSPLADGTELLLVGVANGVDPEPIAWTFRRSDGGVSFYTSLGHPADFANPSFVALLRQGIAWAASH